MIGYCVLKFYWFSLLHAEPGFIDMNELINIIRLLRIVRGLTLYDVIKDQYPII